jgi:hypothetical protein
MDRLMRSWIRRLERHASEDLASFILEDGSRYYYNPISGECFLHAMACVRAKHYGGPFPEPPETIKVLTRARDRDVALEQVAGDTFPYDRQALIERGELVPRSMVAGREPTREGDGLHGS